MINQPDTIQVCIRILNAPESANIMDAYSLVLPAHFPLPRQGESLIIPDNPTDHKSIELQVFSVVHRWSIPNSTAIEVEAALIDIHCFFVSVHKPRFVRPSHH